MLALRRLFTGLIGGLVFPWSALLAAAFAQDSAPPPQPPEFIQESTLLPVVINGQKIRLETLVVRSRAASGRLPLAIVTHGKPGPRDDLAMIHASTYRNIARDLARRGWLVAVVVRQGYGLSEGALPPYGSCSAGHDLLGLFRTEAQDLAAAMATLAARPDVDAGRTIAIGVSAGGAAVLALASRAPPGLKAVVNVSGGLRNETCPYEDKLVSAFTDIGATVKIPTLWIYARNDSLFPPDTAERLRSGFMSKGAQARFAMTDSVGEDGHALFSLSEGRTRWYALLDVFLKENGLPTYGVADVDRMMGGLDPSFRPSLERYLAVPGEKALARPVGGGKLNWFLGGTDLPSARRFALQQCQKQAPACEIIAENNRRVVPPAASAPSQPAGGPASGTRRSSP